MTRRKQEYVEELAKYLFHGGVQPSPAVALHWLEGLIPAAEKPAAAADWKVYFVDHYKAAWMPAEAAQWMPLVVGEVQQPTLPERIAEDIRNKLFDARQAYNQFQEIRLGEGASWLRRYEFSKHVYKQWDGIKRIAWRGDGRPPETIMGAGGGFRPRVSSSVPLWRPADGSWDVDTDTTVCVARDIRGSAFFPLNNDRNTYVYCVLVKEGWNTYYLQKQKAKEGKVTKESPQYAKIVWMFHETCVQTIPPEDVIAGFSVERTFYNPKSEYPPLSGVKFRVVSGHANNDTWRVLDKQQRDSILSQLGGWRTGPWIPSDNATTWLTYGGVVEKEPPDAAPAPAQAAA